MIHSVRREQAIANSESLRLAVLIDADNRSSLVVTELMQEVAKHRNGTVRRAYGDWTTQNLVGWKEQLHRHAIQPIQQFAYTKGKNATDSALIIDAMDWLHAGNVDGFCIVSSDSDFADLCRKLRRRRATLHIVGEEKTRDALHNASDQYLEWVPPEPTPELLDLAQPKPAEVKPPPTRRPKTLINAVALLAASTSDGRSAGCAWLGARGQCMKRTDPAFTAKAHGHAALSDMLKTYPDLVVVSEPGTGDWVSVMPKAEVSASA